MDKSSGVLTISGTGEMYEYSSYDTTPWYNDCSTVKSVVLSDGVTSIGSSAFSGCTGLVNITISDSVTSIGSSAFSGCTNLTSITIPNSVTNIGYSAFSGCTSLSEIILEKGITKIDSNSFRDCTGLVSITIPDSVTSIGSSAFSGCTALASLKIPDGVTTIAGYTFDNCTNLTSITIPDSVTSIGDAAFSGCSNLKDIYYTGSPSQWKQISIGSNNNEFRSAAVHDRYFCGENLTWSFDKETGTLTISGTGEMYAFNYAKEFPWYGERSEITSVVLEEGVANIGGSAFYGCTNLANVVIPSSVTNIGNSAFSGCTGLSSISIPDSVTSIGSYAFSGCTALTSLKIPDGVTTIAGYTFDSCTNLTSLSIPNSLTSVDTYAFKDCTSLKDIYYNGTPSEWRQGNAYYNYVIREASIHYARCGKNVDWSFEKETGILTISGNGAIEDIDEKDCTPWHDERSNIQTIVIKNGVTDIGSCVFCGYTNLINITIPSTVKRLGGYAFGECSNLEFVDIQDLAAWCGIEFGGYMANPLSLGAILYVNGKKAVDLVIPEGVTAISEAAFAGYESLESVTFPNSLQSISAEAFAQCTNLKNVVIPDSVKAICWHAFYACTSLSSISIGSGVEYIDDNFSECPNLTAVYIKDLAAWCGIEFTCEAATPLYYTDAMLYVNGEAATDIVIPDGVQSISCGAFWGYDKMTSVTIPASVTSIPFAFAVSEDSNFNAVYINDLAAWCNIDFSDPEENPLIYAHNLYVNGKLLEQMAIPDGTTTFSAPYAYSGASCIKSVVIPKTLTNIAKNTFYDCNNIKDIYYTGSTDDWKSVRIAANNGSLGEAAVHIAYEVTFDANTDEPVSGLPESAFANDSYIIPSDVPTCAGYKFLGWATTPKGAVEYQPGEAFPITAKTTFYAVWEKIRTSLTFDKTAITLKKGESRKLTVTVTPSDVANKRFTVTSSNPAVAVISKSSAYASDTALYANVSVDVGDLFDPTAESFWIEAVGVGTAVITATSEDSGETATCTVTVTESLENAKAIFTLKEASGRPGDTVKITLSLKTEETINSIAISGISYDKSIMTFTGFSDYEHIEELTVLPPTFDEEKMAIVIALKTAAAFDGDICTLNFKINENAVEGVTAINANSIVKLTSTEIPSAITGGKVSVRLQKLGDIDGNGTVDIDDAILLFQHSMLPELYPISYAGNVDFNKDGTVDIDDAVLLFQYSMLPDLYPLE